MKKLVTIILSIISLNIMAQAPQGVGYQAVATDDSGIELINQNISIRASILSTSATGNIEWEEIHATTTDTFGLFSITIGQGNSTGNGIHTNFADISWGTNTHFLKIEMDVNGGSNYSFMGTNQMMSVPYALYAKNAGIDSTMLANMIESTRKGGCNFEFPEGIDGDIINIIINSSSTSYTVPLGKRLYITNNFSWNQSMLIDGTLLIEPVSQNAFMKPFLPIILNSNQVISASANNSSLYFSGILVNENSDINAVTFQLSNYTVPIGKRLYITYASYSSYNMTLFDTQLNGAQIYATNVSNGAQYLTKPLMFSPGEIITGGHIINGYLADENYFANCGGGGSNTNSTNTIQNGTNIGEILYWDGNEWIGLSTPENGANLTFCNGAPYWGECYEIGDIGPGGGYVFYINGNGGGLEVFLDNIGSSSWGCYNTFIGVTGTNIGDGFLNTNNIIDSCGAASNYAYECSIYSVNGFNDWYMPSKDELNLIYTNLHSTNQTGLFFTNSSGFYISSSEYDSHTVWIQNFSNGSQYNFTKQATSIQTVPIRSF